MRTSVFHIFRDDLLVIDLRLGCNEIFIRDFSELDSKMEDFGLAYNSDYSLSSRWQDEFGSTFTILSEVMKSEFVFINCLLLTETCARTGIRLDLLTI